MKMKSSSSSSQTHTFGCISLFLQKLLCSGASFTYPSDQITEPGFESPEFVDEPARARGGEPGAVARLMGLDSVPVTDKTRVLSRSCSVVNSGDYVKRDDDVIQGKHRRVKSTLEYIELEDDNFFILSFEKGTNDKVLGELKQLGTRRKYKKKREASENQTHKEKDKENDINAMNVSPGRKRPETGELKQRSKEKRKNMRKRREIKLRQNIKNYGRWSRDGDLVNCEVKSMNEEEECRSCDDSSPVSVLDYDRATTEPENTSRRRLSSLLESSKSNETVQEDHRSRESEIPVHGNQEMWLMICRLTLYELEESNSVYRKASKVGDLEGGITEDIASNILDQLLEETITTLSLTSQV